MALLDHATAVQQIKSPGSELAYDPGIPRVFSKDQTISGIAGQTLAVS